MPILRKKEAAKAKAKELQEKYYVDYGDDASTYQLIDKKTGKPAAVDIGGLGVDEGLFTKQRRLKKLVGREVQKNAEQKPISSNVGTGDSGTGIQSKEYIELKDKFDALESKVVGDTSKSNSSTSTTSGTTPRAEFEYKATKIGDATSSTQDAQRQKNSAEADAELKALEDSIVPVVVPKGLKPGDRFKFEGHTYYVKDDGTSEKLKSMGEVFDGSGMRSLSDVALRAQGKILQFFMPTDTKYTPNTRLTPRQTHIMPGISSYPIGPSLEVQPSSTREKGSQADFYTNKNPSTYTYKTGG